MWEGLSLFHSNSSAKEAYAVMMQTDVVTEYTGEIILSSLHSPYSEHVG